MTRDRRHSRARARALYELRDAHRDEYEQLLAAHREAGLGRVQHRALNDLARRHPDEFAALHHTHKHDLGLPHLHHPDEHAHPDLEERAS